MSEVFVAIDAGGTRSTAELRAADGAVVQSFEASQGLSGYLEPADVPDVLRQIVAPIEVAYRRAGLIGRRVSMFVAAAGFAEVTRQNYLDAAKAVLTRASMAMCVGSVSRTTR